MESCILLSPRNNSGSEQDWDAYSERYSAESALSTSPSEIVWFQRIDPRLSRRMDRAVYAANKRCLIENTVEGNALSYVLCLSRWLEPQRVNALEFAWGMQCGTLNLDTRSNVFCLSPKYKQFWENFKWFLLPEEHFIRLFHKAATNNQELPELGDGPYNYRLVAHPDMEAVAIHRQVVFPDQKIEDLKPEHFMFCSYPFSDIGALTCHLHPKFVICHIGWMAARADDALLSQYADVCPGSLELIMMILEICNKWTRPLDKKDPKHLSFFKTKIDPDDIIAQTWSRTGNGRLEPHMSQKRLKKRRNSVKREFKRSDSGLELIPRKKAWIFGKQASTGYAGKGPLGHAI